MAREWFSSPPLAELFRQVERDMRIAERELEKELDFIESTTTVRDGDIVTTQILVPMDTKVEEIKVSLRDGVVTVVTPLVSRTRKVQSTTQSVPVSVDGK